MINELEVRGVGLLHPVYTNNIENVNWEYISSHHVLTEDFMRAHHDRLDWWYISSCQNLSENFIRDFQHLVDWNSISKYQNLSIDFLKEFKDRVNWKNITMYQIKNYDFIKEFQKYLDWSRISEYNFLSEEFIREFKYNIDWRKIKEYIKNNNNRIYYSTEFIKEFAPYFNELYIYNHSANKIREHWLRYYYHPDKYNFKSILNKYKKDFSEIMIIE